MKNGWQGESHRHSCSAKGIKTNTNPLMKNEYNSNKINFWIKETERELNKMIIKNESSKEILSWFIDSLIDEIGSKDSNKYFVSYADSILEQIGILKKNGYKDGYIISYIINDVFKKQKQVKYIKGDV